MPNYYDENSKLLIEYIVFDYAIERPKSVPPTNFLSCLISPTKITNTDFKYLRRRLVARYSCGDFRLKPKAIFFYIQRTDYVALKNFKTCLNITKI